jgi:protoheme IX farnesyltransferase
MMKAATVEAEIAPFRSFGGTREATSSAAVPTRLADYLELTKPRIAVMALFTVAIGYLVGAGSAVEWLVLFHTLLGAGLVAAGGSALNQWLEHDVDSRMQRTRKRPLPAGRLSTSEAVTFGMTLSAIGLLYLFLVVSFAAGLVAAATLVSYVAIYTPLKTATVWNTVIGAVPGALPPVIGWAAARGWDGLPGAAALFLILFIWQIPHFLAIATFRREEYEAAGLKVLPSVHGDRAARWHSLAWTALLLPLSLVLTPLGVAGWFYFTAAVLMGGHYFFASVRAVRAPRGDTSWSKKVFFSSLAYLPVVFAVLMADAG